MTPMERTVQSNLLRYAAGTQMFCPGCNVCLNWPTTVLVELRKRQGINSLAASLAICDKCFDKKESKLRDICAEAGLLMEVTRKEPRPRSVPAEEDSPCAAEASK